MVGAGVLGLAGVLVCAGLGFGTWLTTATGDRWLEEKVQELASGALTEGSFATHDVEVGLDGTVMVRGLQLRSGDGAELLTVPELSAELDWTSLMAGRVHLRRVQVEGPYVDLVTDDDGLMLLSRMFGGTTEVDPDPEPWAGLPVPIRLSDLSVHGLELRMGGPEGTSTRVVGLDLGGRVEGEGTTIELHDVRAGALLDLPGPLPIHATLAHLAYRNGDVEVEELAVQLPGTELSLNGEVGDELDLELMVPSLHLDPLDPVAGDAGITGHLEGSARVLGSWSDLRCIVTMDGQDGQGGLRLRLGADLTAEETTWSVEGELHELAAHRLVRSLEEGEPIVIDGDLTLGGQGTGWPVGLVGEGRFRGGEQALGGVGLSSLDLGVSVEEGTLYFADDSVLNGIIGEIRPSGWYDLTNGLVDVTAEGVLEPEELAAVGAAGFGRPGRFEARVIGDLASEAPLDVIGTTRFAPFVYQSDVSFSQLQLGFDLRIQGGTVGGGLSIDGTAMDAYGVAAAGLVADDLRLSVTPDGEVALAGDLGLTAVNMPSVFRTDQLSVGLDVAVAGEAVNVGAELGLGPYALADQPGSGGTGRVQLAGDLLDFELDLADGGRQAAYVLGRFRLDEQTVDIPQIRFAPTRRVDWATDRPVRFRLTEHGGIADADVALSSTLGSLTLEGQIGAAGPLDAVVKLDDVQLDMASELYPDAADGVSGRASAVLRFHGTAEDPDVRATIDLRDLYVPEQVRYLDLSGSLQWDDHTLRPDLKLAVADEPFAVVEGAVPLPGTLAAPELELDQDARLVLGLRPAPFQRVAQLSPAVPADALPVGEYSGQLTLSGPLRQPEVHLGGLAEFVIDGWSAPGRVEFDLLREGESVSFWADLREGFAQRANVGGGGSTRFGEIWTWAVEGGEEPDFEDYTLFLDNMFVSGVLLGIPVDSLVALAGTDLDVQGEVVGGLSVSGSPVSPVVEGGMHLIDPVFAGEKAEGAYASLTPAEQGYTLDAQVSFEDGGGLALQGPVPIEIDLDRPFEEWSVDDLVVVADGAGVPLSLLALAVDGVEKAEGVVEIKGSVVGKAHDPEPVLAITLRDGALRYDPLDLKVSDLDFQMTANKRRVVLQRLDATLEPRKRFRATSLDIDGEVPRLAITGSAMLEDWVPAAMSAQVALRNGPWVSASDDLEVRLDGDVQVSGRWPELTVEGGLEVVQTTVVLDAASFITQAPLALDERMVVTRASIRQAEEEEDEEELPPIYADFVVDVGVELNRNVEVNVTMPFVDDLGSLGAAVARMDASARLGGDLDVTMVDGEPNLVGEVDVLEGSVRVLRSAFDLDEGKVIFSGADPSNPNLDLTAIMNVTGATVEMAIAGTPEQPEIDFTSEEYPDQTQIMTILLTGQAPDSMDADQGQGTAQALAGLLLNSLFAGQSLGSFSIEPDGSVKLGVPISQAVYANSQLAPSANPTENRLTVGLEWSVLPQVVASGAVGDRTQSADVFWEIRF